MKWWCLKEGLTITERVLEFVMTLETFFFKIDVISTKVWTHVNIITDSTTAGLFQLLSSVNRPGLKSTLFRFLIKSSSSYFTKENLIFHKLPQIGVFKWFYWYYSYEFIFINKKSTLIDYIFILFSLWSFSCNNFKAKNAFSYFQCQNLWWKLHLCLLFFIH